MPIRTKFPRFYTILCGPHVNKTRRFYCIHKCKNYKEHTTYPTHLKLTDKNKEHAYAEQLMPHGQCVVILPFSNFQYSNILTAVYVCASSIQTFWQHYMFVHLVWWIIQQTILELHSVKYSNFTLDDKLFNISNE